MKIEDVNTWIQEHKTHLTCAALTLGGIVAATYLLRKPTQKIELKSNITPIQPKPQLQQPSGNSKGLWNKEVLLSYQESQGLTLPQTRFEQTPQLSGENYQTVWQPGDFTLRRTASDGLIVDRHILDHWNNDPYWIETALIKRQPYNIHIDNGDLTRLKEVIKDWRCDDVLRPVSLNGNELRFVHKLTGESFAGSLVDLGEKPTFWLMTLEND